MLGYIVSFLSKNFNLLVKVHCVSKESSNEFSARQQMSRVNHCWAPIDLGLDPKVQGRRYFHSECELVFRLFMHALQSETTIP